MNRTKLDRPMTTAALVLAAGIVALVATEFDLSMLLIVMALLAGISLSGSI